MWKSIGALAAGVVAVVAVTTLVDVVVHALAWLPPAGRPMNHLQSLLALSYRIVIGVGGASLTARLAPSNPMRHVMILGVIGTLVGAAGAAATWNLGLGPHWYPIAVAALALPQSWLGAVIVR